MRLGPKERARLARPQQSGRDARAPMYSMNQSSRFTPYLYVLGAEVIVAAAYLFHTYWIAMRNMMYANR